MVEVFKTNVQKKTQSTALLPMLTEIFPSCKINFDLSDCDKILITFFRLQILPL